MTDGLDQALIHVALDLLAADPALVVYDGIVPGNPTPAPPYVVVYTTIDHSAVDDDNALDGLSKAWSARWYIHSIGATAQAARAVSQRVRAALLDVRPVIGTLRCGLIREEPGSPAPGRDESTGVPVIDAVSVYSLRATN